MIDKDDMIRSMIGNYQSSLIINVLGPPEHDTSNSIVGFGSKQETTSRPDIPGLFATIRPNTFGAHPPLYCLEEPSGTISITDGGVTDQVYRKACKHFSRNEYKTYIDTLGIPGFGDKNLPPSPIAVPVVQGDIMSAITSIVGIITRVDAGVEAVDISMRINRKSKSKAQQRATQGAEKGNKTKVKKHAVKKVSKQNTEDMPGETEQGGQTA